MKSTIFELALLIYELKIYHRNWKNILRKRFAEGNGNSKVKLLQSSFDYEKVFKLIKKDSKVTTIQSILEKCKV